MEYAVRLNRISKRYGKFVAVNDLSLDVPTGKILGFLGRNGAGKTTTIRMLMSIMYPDSGSIEILGHPRAVDVKDRIGYLPEERGLYRKMTLEQTLNYFGRLKGLKGSELRERIDSHLLRVGLQDYLRKPTESLSKGMQQKLQFVSTILHDPELVILDEPFSGLDPLNMEVLKELMFELRDRGVTVIFSTHQIHHAQQICDRIAMINKGQMLLQGTIDEIQSRFATRVVTLTGDGDFQPLARRVGVTAAEFAHGQVKLELNEDVNANDVLRAALDLGRVSRFEVHRPDLHSIFVRLAGDDPQDAEPATNSNEVPSRAEAIHG